MKNLKSFNHGSMLWLFIILIATIAIIAIAILSSGGSKEATNPNEENSGLETSTQTEGVLEDENPNDTNTENANTTNPNTETSTEEDTSLDLGAVTVNYDGAKFSPASITVREGDSVTFVNNSSGGMSVASDPHPSHANYPEFDQYKTGARGQKTFTFKFDKAGSWLYHNHLNASATGTVIVTAE